MNSIEVRGICKSFGSLQVLNNINLTIENGEFVSIIGASGAGKTTLLQLIGSLDKPNAGTITINTQHIQAMNSNTLSEFRNQHIGFVFQFHQLLPEFTALENVMIPALIAKNNKKEAEKKAKELLDYLKLSDRLEHKPSELSGGEKQRVAVARALINRPSIVLADEPSGSLDTKNKEELHQLLVNLRNDFGITLLVVTHDASLANMSDRVIEMKDGLIVGEHLKP
ncbi:MAG: ABC transporter ATP-binding protein [Paludibacteraceae bacterium]|nr:ABC transporter ATP-binding protein [Paludibacteraceae bacterium]MBP6284183.1 ABC transporter ATP-binding protein [Paludibacteraceae bacterium]